MPLTRPVSPDVEHVDSAMEPWARLIRRTAELKRMADAKIGKWQKRYKCDHDKRIRFEPSFAPGNYVFVEHAPLATTTAERLAAENYSKICRHRLGPYWILSVGPEVVRIMQYQIKNTIGINWVTRTTHANGTQNGMVSATTTRIKTG